MKNKCGQVVKLKIINEGMWSGDLTSEEYHILDPNKADRSITINFIHLSLCLDSQSQENLSNIKTVLEIPVRVEDFHFSLSCY